MPRGDRTGPMGAGPMTGWGSGFCAAHRPVRFGRNLRRGVGRGMGPGRGFGWFWKNADASADPSEWERKNLEEEREWLKRQMEMIDAELEQGKEKENE